MESSADRIMIRPEMDGRRPPHRRGGDSVRRVLCLGAAAAAIVAFALAQAPRTSAASTPAITVYAVTPPGTSANQSEESSLTTGPDGALWFTWTFGMQAGYGLGRITTTGVVRTYRAPTGYTMDDIASGGGYLWVSETHDGDAYIGEWTTQGTLQQTFPVPGDLGLGITWGPDGALWFTGATGGGPDGGPTGCFIGRMTTQGVVTQYSLPPGSGADPASNSADDIIAGPDGALWFDLPTQASIGSITTSGTITEYPITGARMAVIGTVDQSLAAGPDGAVWAAAFWTDGVARTEAGGTVTVYPVAGTPSSVAPGTEGNLWLITGGDVVSLSTSGDVTAVYPIPADLSVEGPLTVGPDGNVWFAAQGEVGRLEVSNPPPSASSTAAPLPSPTPTPSPTPLPSPAPTPTPPPSLISTPIAVPTASPQPVAVRPTATPATPADGGSAWPVFVVVAFAVLLGAATGWIYVRRRLTPR
jgi:hypothetical protein